jgi:hypothetical protein
MVHIFNHLCNNLFNYILSSQLKRLLHGQLNTCAIISQRNVAEMSTAKQQLVKRHFCSNEYARNAIGNVGDGVF